MCAAAVTAAIARSHVVQIKYVLKEKKLVSWAAQEELELVVKPLCSENLQKKTVSIEKR
jgi:hypothetical protein